MNPLEIIQTYYHPESWAYEILITHSRSVADKAVALAEAHPEMKPDIPFIREAAMLHDLGIFLCHAPAIECFGTEPYICHGRLGAELLRAAGYPAHARVCERHTGAGLSREDIVRQALPLPHEDFLPHTMEEKVIRYADKFYSKTHIDDEKTSEQAERSLAKFGEAGLERFRAWEKMFAI